MRDLKVNQEERRNIDPETTAKIDSILSELTMMATGIQLPFDIVIDDPGIHSIILIFVFV